MAVLRTHDLTADVSVALGILLCPNTLSMHVVAGLAARCARLHTMSRVKPTRVGANNCWGCHKFATERHTIRGHWCLPQTSCTSITLDGVDELVLQVEARVLGIHLCIAGHAEMEQKMRSSSSADHLLYVVTELVGEVCPSRDCVWGFVM